MPRPTGKQWVRLYRGLHEGKDNDPLYVDDFVEDSQNRPVGIHWSSSPAVARTFARHGALEYRPGEETDGLLIQAVVHRRHIIGQDDPTAIDAGVYPEWHPGAQREREVTLRPGAPIHVQKVEQTYTSKAEAEDPDVPPYAVELPLSRKSIRRA